MKSKISNGIPTLLGLLLLAGGLFLVKSAAAFQGSLSALPYVCIGVGSGLFGHGMGNVISEHAIRKDPELKKRQDIEKNDEREHRHCKSCQGKGI